MSFVVVQVVLQPPRFSLCLVTWRTGCGEFCWREEQSRGPSWAACCTPGWVSWTSPTASSHTNTSLSSPPAPPSGNNQPRVQFWNQVLDKNNLTDIFLLFSFSAFEQKIWCFYVWILWHLLGSCVWTSVTKTNRPVTRICPGAAGCWGRCWWGTPDCPSWTWGKFPSSRTSVSPSCPPASLTWTWRAAPPSVTAPWGDWPAAVPAWSVSPSQTLRSLTGPAPSCTQLVLQFNLFLQRFFIFLISGYFKSLAVWHLMPVHQTDVAGRQEPREAVSQQVSGLAEGAEDLRLPQHHRRRHWGSPGRQHRPPGLHLPRLSPGDGEVQAGKILSIGWDDTTLYLGWNRITEIICLWFPVSIQ